MTEAPTKRRPVAPAPYRSAVSSLQWVKDKDGTNFDGTDARRIAWCVFEAIHDSGYEVVERDRYNRLVAAACKLRKFSRSIVGYGGSVPESEALQDDDLVMT